MSIWASRSVPAGDQTKATTSYSRWRYLVGERLGELLGDQDLAYQRIHEYGVRQLGIDFDDQLSVDQMADKLSK